MKVQIIEGQDTVYAFYVVDKDCYPLILSGDYVYERMKETEFLLKVLGHEIEHIVAPVKPEG